MVLHVIKCLPAFVNAMKKNVSPEHEWTVVQENLSDINVDVKTVTKKVRVVFRFLVHHSQCCISCKLS